jgi:uncharacterized protein with ParB-like and HNH nuclease domain
MTTRRISNHNKRASSPRVTLGRDIAAPVVERYALVSRIASEDRFASMSTTLEKFIDARNQSVKQVLADNKYTIDYYQREFKWEKKHIADLLRDLESRFSENYDESHERSKVREYSHYFLGSIIVNKSNANASIIDGQQRLTSLTLLLTYLNNLQKERQDKVRLENLIFSEVYGAKSFNLDIPEREACMDALYNGRDFDPYTQVPSIRNLHARYADIQEIFPDTLKEGALPYFIDWLTNNVELVEITAYSEQEAYTIFETMNDRGLSLGPTDMLKGFLLSRITDNQKRSALEGIWKTKLQALQEAGDEETSSKNEQVTDFFKAWLRAKYAESIRDGKKGAANQDFENIGTTFHIWVRDKLNLTTVADFDKFVGTDFKVFSEHYLSLLKASTTFDTKLEFVYYNALNNFTLQYPLALAPVKASDDQAQAIRKMNIVACFLDNWIVRRIVNSKTLRYSSIVRAMFNWLKEIRDLSADDLATELADKLTKLDEQFDSLASNFYLHQMNKKYVRYMLARMTRYIESNVGTNSEFAEYARGSKFDVEHILADTDENWTDFESIETYYQERERFGALLLLPQSINRSLQAKKFTEKLDPYFGENILARSLHSQCYKNNPQFLKFIKQHELPFNSHQTFGPADLKQRSEAYLALCKLIWSPDRLGDSVAATTGKVKR